MSNKQVNLDYVADPKIMYPKMFNLYKRDSKTHKLITDTYAKEEFLIPHKWHVTEKIDGTNVRIFYDGTQEPLGYIEFRGRNDNSNMPKKLHEYLKDHFTVYRLNPIFGDAKVVLFGEGYGAGIQKGGLYRADQRFILFDIKIGIWWLEYENVADIAKSLDIPVVPSFGEMNLTEIIELVKDGFQISITDNIHNTVCAEGIVATSVPLLLFRNTYPLKFKLKVRDLI